MAVGVRISQGFWDDMMLVWTCIGWMGWTYIGLIGVGALDIYWID